MVTVIRVDVRRIVETSLVVDDRDLCGIIRVLEGQTVKTLEILPLQTGFRIMATHYPFVDIIDLLHKQGFPIEQPE